MLRRAGIDDESLSISTPISSAKADYSVAPNTPVSDAAGKFRQHSQHRLNAAIYPGIIAEARTSLSPGELSTNQR